MQNTSNNPNRLYHYHPYFQFELNSHFTPQPARPSSFFQSTRGLVFPLALCCSWVRACLRLYLKELHAYSAGRVSVCVCVCVCVYLYYRVRHHLINLTTLTKSIWPRKLYFFAAPTTENFTNKYLIRKTKSRNEFPVEKSVCF